MAWKNIGRIKNAINIPFDMLSEDKVAKYRGKTIILYDMMMFDNELFSYAKRLKEYGITELYLIDGGMAKLNEQVYEFQKSELRSLIDQSN
jgi:rhodanese-related sulfurtransferase